MVTTATSEWRELGNTDYASFAKAISRSSQAGASPMAAEAQGIYDALCQYGLARLGSAMAWHETKNGSWPGPIPQANHNPWAVATGWQNGEHTWAKYSTYTEAAIDWGKQLLNPKGPYAKTVSLRDMLLIYAPATENDTFRYLKVVCDEIDRLPREGASVVPATNPFKAPKMYDIDKDYAAFGVTARQAKKIAANRFWDRNGETPKAIVLHVQEGTSAGSLRYWADTPGVQASSTVMIQKDGTVLQIIDEADGPWTNGDVASPTAKGQAFLDQSGGKNPNLFTLSVEAEGYYNGDHPEPQIASICWQVWEWLVDYGLEPGDVYRHADFNQNTRPNCPGAYFNEVMARVSAAWGDEPAPPAADWPNRPEWMPEYLIKVQFPEADPNGVRTAAWLAYCGATGRAPARKAFVQKGTPGELILFDDGLIIDLDGNSVGGPL